MASSVPIRLAAIGAVSAAALAVPSSGAVRVGETPERGGHVVFSVFQVPLDDRRSGCSGIYAASSDGKRLVQLTARSALWPAPAPNGRLLAFADIESEEGYELRLALYVLDLPTGVVRRLATTTTLYPFVLQPLLWSPSSDAFLVTEAVGTRWDLQVVTLDGRWTRLLAQPFRALEAAWSPDGRHIAVTVASTAETRDRTAIWLVRRRDAVKRRLAADAVAPVWAPHGRTIAFFRPSSLTAREARGDLWLANADGRRPRRVARDVLYQRPLWFPNGVRMVFVRESPLRLRDPTTDDVGDAHVLDRATGRSRFLARKVIPLTVLAGGRKILVLRPFRLEHETMYLVATIEVDGRDERRLAVVDEEDVNVGSLPAWTPARSVVSAAGAFAPRDDAPRCVEAVGETRDRLGR